MLEKLLNKIRSSLSVQKTNLKFDPTHDYGNANMKRHNNLVLWKFGQLIKTLITLASDAERQKEIVGAGVATDDMVEDFDTFFTLSFTEFYDNKLLTDEALSLLKQLDKFLDDHSFDKTPEFWNDDNLDTNADWKTVRLQAKNILVVMKMDDLEIEFDREEKYGMSKDGKQQLIMQQTKTRIERK